MRIGAPVGMAHDVRVPSGISSRTSLVARSPRASTQTLVQVVPTFNLNGCIAVYGTPREDE